MDNDIKTLFDIGAKGISKGINAGLPIEQFNNAHAVGLITAGIIDANNRPFRYGSWKNLLEDLGFWRDVLKEVDELRQQRWITPPRNKSLRWMILSNRSKEFYNLVKDDIDTELQKRIIDMYDLIEETKKEIDINPQVFESVKQRIQSEGIDGLIYISSGDYERSMWLLPHIMNKRNQPYGSIYVCYPSDDYFPKERINEIKILVKDISVDEPVLISGKWWGKNRESIIDAINFPRKRLDIFLPGFPRQTIYSIAMALEKTKPYNYNYIYAKAERYPNINAKVIDGITIHQSSYITHGSNVVIAFAEYTNHRINSDYFKKKIPSDSKIILFYPDSNAPFSSKKEIELNNKVITNMKDFIQSSNFSLETHPVSYTDPEMIFRKIRLFSPGYILASGSRLGTIGIVKYVLHCEEKNQQTPILIFPHLTADSYATGVIKKVYPQDLIL